MVGYKSFGRTFAVNFFFYDFLRYIWVNKKKLLICTVKLTKTGHRVIILRKSKENNKKRTFIQSGVSEM